MTKIISYNVNGIRAALTKGWIDWVQQENPDVICLQEIKADADQLDLSLFEKAGYKYHSWHSAEKKGYSGVAILSKKKPTHVEIGKGKTLSASQLCERLGFDRDAQWTPVANLSGGERRRL